MGTRYPGKWLLTGLCALTAGVGSGYPQAAKTYCNPLDLDYQYNFEQRERKIG